MTTTPDGDVVFHELRCGSPDDPHPLVVGRYIDLADALQHGRDDFTNVHGAVDQLVWYPTDDTETLHRLYAVNLGDEVETEWHIATSTISASYDPDAEN